MTSCLWYAKRVRQRRPSAHERRQYRGRTKDERGSMSVELVLLTPALVACILLIAAGARYVAARGEATDAAYAAARAGSLTTSQDVASAAARTAAYRSLADSGRSCTNLSVTVQAGEFRPGGQIRATVTCTANLADLTGLGLPGHRAFTASATVPLERYREFS